MIDNAYLIYDAEMSQKEEEFIRNAPVCDVCGEKILDEYFDIRDEKWCWECLKQTRREVFG